MKPYLCLRLANYNLVSFGALLGACSRSLLAQFELRLWRTDTPPPISPAQRGLFLFSFMMPHQSEVFDSLELLKTATKAGANLSTWAGGAQASSNPDGVASMGFDAVFAGEGEILFPEMLERWLHGDPIAPLLRADPGSILLDRFPGFHPLIQYLPPIEITRGCSFGCMFCAVPGLNRGQVRHRSVAAVVDIARRYLEVKPQRRRIKFLAPNAFAYGSQDGRTPNIPALKSLLQGLKDAGIPAISFGSFPSEVRPDFVTREVLDTVVPFLSNRTIVMGIQHSSDEVLKRLNRGHTVAQAEKAVALLREFGFTAHVDFIIGLPEETSEQQAQMLDFMEFLVQRYGVRIHMHTFMPIPGSPWWNRRAEPISEPNRERLKRLEKAGILDGWWENQIGYSRTPSDQQG